MTGAAAHRAGGGAAGHGTGLPADVSRILVLGASRSGSAAAAGVRALGLDVVLSDRKEASAIPGLEQLIATGVEFRTEERLASDWPDVQLVIKSPGVPNQAWMVGAARDRGLPVWSEIELAYALLPNAFDAVTGTNGKTTTTALLGHLFESAGRPVRVLGNIGTAVTSVVGSAAPDEELVVEVSSFQLEDVHSFRPAAGVFLNLTPDHLDRHGSMEGYLACKATLFARQGPGDVAVLNLADPAVAALGRGLREKPQGPRVSFFAVSPDTEWHGARPDSWVEAGWLVLEHERLLPADGLRIPGRHNLENALAAAAAALGRGVPRAAVAEGLRTFRGVPHRLEPVDTVAGVLYVNDSKATNVDATLTALRAYPEGTHLILGGRDKASDYRPVARACARGCRGVYLIGEATPLVADAFAQVRGEEGMASVPQPMECDDLETAVRTAVSRARSGETVLLAPACASFDQYSGFEERGDHFRALVKTLAEGQR